MPDGRVPWTYLDTLHEEPFFAAYKSRVRELLAPQPGQRHLDVGGGTGTDARAVGGVSGFVALVERDRDIATEARRRGSSATIVADGVSLPLPDAAFDTCVADRVLQHVGSPSEVIQEIVRVVRPTGRVVTVDPDLDTQVISVDALDLARRIFRFRADSLRPSGTIGSRASALFRRAGLVDVTVEARTLVVQDLRVADHVMGLRDWALFARDAGMVTADEADAWPRMVDEAAARGEFLYAVTYFLTAGRRP